MQRIIIAVLGSVFAWLFLIPESWHKWLVLVLAIALTGFIAMCFNELDKEDRRKY